MVSIRKPKTSNSNSNDDSTNADKDKGNNYSVYSTKKPGAIIFKPGRKDLNSLKSSLNITKKNKDGSKSKIKSLLPRPGNPRPKTGRSKTRFLSLEKAAKMGFDNETKAPAKTDKSVYDMSLNESVTVLPQMSYTDFRDQNPAMEEIKQALKAKSAASPTSSPHGIMLVTRNGKRTKPRARSKSVSYAKKLTEVHLRTPSQASDDSMVAYELLTAAAGRTPPRKKQDSDMSKTHSWPDKGDNDVSKTPPRLKMEDAVVSKTPPTLKNIENGDYSVVPDTPDCRTKNLEQQIHSNEEESSLCPPVSHTVPAISPKRSKVSAEEMVQETPQPQPILPNKRVKVKPPKLDLEECEKQPKSAEKTFCQDMANHSEQDVSYIPSSQEYETKPKKKTSKSRSLNKAGKTSQKSNRPVEVTSTSLSVDEDSECKVLVDKAGSRKRSSRRLTIDSSISESNNLTCRKSDARRSNLQNHEDNQSIVPEVKRSRRAASARVSYKEPSLNIKMRQESSKEEGTEKHSKKKSSAKRSSRSVLNIITNTEDGGSV